MNQTPSKVVYLVVWAISLLALTGVTSLCATLFWRNYADPAVLSALISITSGLVGSLGTILTNTRSQSPGGSTTSTVTTTTEAPPPSDTPTPVVVTNKPEEPVPTIEAT